LLLEELKTIKGPEEWKPEMPFKNMHANKSKCY